LNEKFLYKAQAYLGHRGGQSVHHSTRGESWTVGHRSLILKYDTIGEFNVDWKAEY